MRSNPRKTGTISMHGRLVTLPAWSFQDQLHRNQRSPIDWVNYLLNSTFWRLDKSRLSFGNKKGGRGVDKTTMNAQKTQGQQQSPSIRPGDLSWPFWPVVPLYPYGRRRTLREEVVKDTVWTFDQLQGILYVVVPIRMTVVKLEAGGLLVYAPIAPTKECIRLVKELEAKHGEVKYIILPTASGLEHKVFVGPFARQFPASQVFVTANQWSYPVNLPLGWLGFPTKRTQVLPESSGDAPFGDEFDYEVLSINLGRGSFEEVALLHKRSRTLLLTDSVLSVPEKPPEIVQLDPYPLLFHARDNAFDVVEDSEANRC